MFKQFIISAVALMGVLSATQASWAMGPFRPHTVRMMPRMAAQSRTMVVPHSGFVQVIPQAFHDRMLAFDRDRFLRHRYMGMGWAYGLNNMMYGSASGYGGGMMSGSYGGGGSSPAPAPTYAAPLPGPVGSTSSADNAVVRVTLPSYGTVWVNDFKTEQGPITKDYVTPPLEAGQNYTYQVSARFMVAGLEVNPTKTVTAHAGDRLNIDFSRSTR